MEAKDLVLGRQATEKEQQVLREAQALLDSVNLEIVGTRPKDR